MRFVFEIIRFGGVINILNNLRVLGLFGQIDFNFFLNVVDLFLLIMENFNLFLFFSLLRGLLNIGGGLFFLSGVFNFGMGMFLFFFIVLGGLNF